MRVLAVMVLLSAFGCAHNPTAIDTEVRIELTLTSPNYVVGEPAGNFARGISGLSSDERPLLEPGRYRMPVGVGRPSGGFHPYYSPEFEVRSQAHS